MNPAPLMLVTPELPPRSGGVSDYVLKLASHWPGAPKVVAWVARGARDAERVLPGNWTIRDLTPGAGFPDRGVLLVHYTQYGYAKCGVPWRLPADLRRWRSSGGARRLAVFFHETWLEGPLWRRRGVAAPFARWCARELAASADVVMTNCAKHAVQLGGAREMSVLPVPSNIPRLCVREPRDLESALRVVIFGLPETRLRTLAAHGAFLRWLGRTGALGELVLLGAGEEGRFARAGARLARELAGERLRRVGESGPATVSRELAHADLGLSAYAEDEVGKSGTLAALFTHGCTVGCAGHNAGGRAFDLSCAQGGEPREWRALRQAAERESRDRRARDYAEQHLDWGRHSANMAELLGKAGLERDES